MTLEELKVEANKLGYKLVKNNYVPKLLICTCGHNRRTHWFNSKENTHILVCKNCGKKAKGNSKTDVINNWNKMIESELK